MADRLLPGIGFVPDNYEGLVPGIGFVQNTGGGASLATALGLDGPASGMAGYASEDFTITVNGALSGSKVVTPDDGGQGGSFNPASVTLTADVLGANFTYTAASAGAKTITVTASGLTSDSMTFTAAAYVAPPSVTIASVVFSGDDVTVNYNLGDQTDSGQATLTANGSGVSKPAQPITIDNDANTGTTTFVDCEPGTYSTEVTVFNVIDFDTDATGATIVIGEISGEIGGSGAPPIIRRALINVDGIPTLMTNAQVGTGLKPLVLVGTRIRQRQASEGTPLVKVGNRLTLLHNGETLEA